MKILLTDDHALFREGMRHVLSQLGEQVQILEAADLSQALDLASQNPDLNFVLLDLHMPGITGLDGLNTFRQKFASLPVIVLSASTDQEGVRRALAAGAAGFIPKSSTGNVVIAAIKLVLSGGIYLPPLLLDPSNSVTNPDAAAQPNDHAFDPKLSPRQLDVLSLLSEGKTNKHIARELNLSEGTVKMHLATIFGSLHVNNRTEAVIAAKKLDLLFTKTRT